MTVIELPDDQAAALKAKAAAQGLTLNGWLGKLAKEEEAPASPRRRSPEEVRAWLDELASLSDRIPPRPDDTFSREMIYQDHP